MRELDRSASGLLAHQAQFQDVKAKIEKRKRKLVDYDSSRHAIEQLRQVCNSGRHFYDRSMIFDYLCERAESLKLITFVDRFCEQYSISLELLSFSGLGEEKGRSKAAQSGREEQRRPTNVRVAQSGVNAAL